MFLAIWCKRSAVDDGRRALSIERVMPYAMSRAAHIKGIERDSMMHKVIACYGVLAAGIAVLCGQRWIAWVLWMMNALAWGALAICDCDTRLMPRELAWMAAGCGVCRHAMRDGWEELAFGAASAVVAVAACKAVAWILGVLHEARTGGPLDAPAVGGGDVRGMVALALFEGYAAPAGLCLSWATAALCSTGAMALRRMRGTRSAIRGRKAILQGCRTDQDACDSTFPLAPFLALGVLAGPLLS